MSYTNPNGKFRNLSRFASADVDKPEVSWTDFSDPGEIGAAVQMLSRESVRVCFNRSKTGKQLIVTLTAGGETHNVFIETKEDWSRFLNETLAG